MSGYPLSILLHDFSLNIHPTLILPTLKKKATLFFFTAVKYVMCLDRNLPDSLFYRRMFCFFYIYWTKHLKEHQ